MNEPVLVVRTVSVEKLSMVLDACVSRWPERSIWILTTPARLTEVSRDVRVGGVIEYRSVEGGYWEKTVIEKRFISVVVPVANEGGSGYANVLRACSRIETEAFYICSRCKLLVELSSSEFNRRWRLELALASMFRFLGKYWASRILGGK